MLPTDDDGTLVRGVLGLLADLRQAAARPDPRPALSAFASDARLCVLRDGLAGAESWSALPPDCHRDVLGASDFLARCAACVALAGACADGGVDAAASLFAALRDVDRDVAAFRAVMCRLPALTSPPAYEQGATPVVVAA